MKLNINYLSAYLPHDLECHLMGEMVDDYADPTIPKTFKIKGVTKKYVNIQDNGNWNYEEVLPILKPMSDLISDEQFRLLTLGKGKSVSITQVGDKVINNVDDLEFWIIQYLLENHYDIYNLIDNNLAVNVNTLTPQYKTVTKTKTKINLLKQRIAEVDKKRSELLHSHHIKDADKYYSYSQCMKTALHIFENDN